MEDYYEYLDSNGVTTLYKLIKDDTVALIDSYTVTINGITTTLDTHINNTDIHTPISDIENMVDTKISGLVNSAPETLDTLKELSDALGNDPNFATTVANQIGNKASKDSVYTKEETNTLLEDKANSIHTHVVSDITDFPTIPTKVSELSNDSNFVTSTELHDYATKNDLNSKQDALSEEQLSNIDSIPDKANKSDLSTVATSGSYKDLLDRPVIPEGADLSDYYNKGETDNLLNSKANTSDLAVVAKSGNYNDLVDTPTIPKVYNKTLTIQKNGTNVATFTSNSNTDVTADITVPTKVSELSNDSGFITGISWDKVTNKPTLATVATSGSYTDLSNTPAIPTKVSQLENDTGFINALTDVVDTKSNQTIGGDKSFSKPIYRKADITTSTVEEVYRFTDTNAKPCGSIYNRMHWYNNNIYNRHQAYNATSGKDMYFEVLSHNDGSGVVNTGGSVTNNKNLTTVTNATGNTYVATMGWVNNPATSTNVVHRSGNEIIEGIKIFTNVIISKNNLADLSVTPTEYHANHNYTFTDKNNVSMGHIEYCQRPTGVNDIGIFARDKNGVYHGIHINTSNEIIPLMTADSDSYSLGSINHKWGKAYINKITCTRFTHSVNNGSVYITGGSEYDKGATLFLHGEESSDAGTFIINSRDKTRSLYLVGRPDGILKWTGRIESLEVLSTTANAFMAQCGGYTCTLRNDGSDTYLLMSAKDGVPGTWTDARPLQINNATGLCSINGNANSAYYSDTPATTDNSTRIATTAWVRTYVNSVAGSNTVGSSVSAYWSNSSNVTATGQASSGGQYISCYSDYITKTPTVGTIYSGAQLYTVLNASASATGHTSNSIYFTTTTAQATFSNPISTTGKYLCTTANAVRLRAYTTSGSTSSVGTSSVVDNTSTKSIFIRVQ